MNDTWPPPPDRRDPQSAEEAPVDRRFEFRQWLFSPREESSRWSIVVWWEKRRLAYNLIAGGAGFVSFVLFEIIMSAPGMLAPGEDAVEPIALFLAPIVMNICYSAGWVFELAASIFGEEDTRRLGPNLLKIGLVFSFIVVCIPTIAALIRLLAR